MFASARAENLDINVPPPMAVFERTVVSDENAMLAERSRDPRLLQRQQLRQYRRAFAAVTYALQQADMLDIIEQLDALRRAGREAKLRHREAHAVNQPATAAVLRDVAREYAALVRSLDRKISWPRTLREVFSGRAAHARRLASRRTLRELLRLYIGLKSALAEHDDAVNHKRARNDIRERLYREANLYASIIIERWNRLGHSYQYTRRVGTRLVHKTDRVKFERCEVTDDAVWFKIKVSSRGFFNATMDHLPRGVSVNDLIDPMVLNDLTHACRREVTTPHTDGRVGFVNGAWLRVSRLSSDDGLPKDVPLSPVWAEYPRQWHEKFPIPMGVKIGRLINYVHLAEHPHLMICGQTGSGKSNAFDVLIGTLVKYHAPSAIQLVLADLKEGVGFVRWERLQHLAQDVVTDTAELLTMLKRLEALRKKRTLALKGHADNIDDYNRIVDEERRMPRIICIIDEFQQVAADKERRAEIHSLTHQLTAKARSAGIHLILGTQTPYADQVPSPIRGNITFVATGRQRMIGAAIATMGGKEATELPKIPGRMWLQDGMDEYAVQMPYMSGDNRKDALMAAASWPPYAFRLDDAEDAAPLVFDHEALLDYVTTYADGKLQIEAVQTHAKEFGVSERKVAAMVKEAIASIEANDGTLEWGGETWQLVKIRRGYELQKLAS